MTACCPDRDTGEQISGWRMLASFPSLVDLHYISMLGASITGGFWKGLIDWLLGMLMLLVMVIIRLVMDRKVRNWRRRNGDSGMKTG